MKKINFLIPFFILLLNFESANADRINSSREYDYDRWGSDYKVIEIPGDWGAYGERYCDNACYKDPACKAWTYVRPNYQGPNPKCHLKNTIPASTPNSCCISGMIISNPSLPPVLLNRRILRVMPDYCSKLWCSDVAVATMRDSKLTQYPIKPTSPIPNSIVVGNNHDTRVMVLCSRYDIEIQPHYYFALIDIITASKQESINSAQYWKNVIEQKITSYQCPKP